MPYSVLTLSMDTRLPSVLQSCPHGSGLNLPDPVTYHSMAYLCDGCGALTSVLFFVFGWRPYTIHSLLMLLLNRWLLDTVGASCPSPLVARGHF